MAALTRLAEDVGVSERTLRRAINDGALRATRPTPRTLQLALSERQYVRRSWTLLSRLRQALRTEHNVRFALLFGSAARGTDAPASDVDVLVDMRDDGLSRLVDLEAKLGAATGRRVDVVRLVDAAASPAFLAGIAADGRVLVDRDDYWPRLRARETDLRRRAQVHEAESVQAALANVDRLRAGRNND